MQMNSTHEYSNLLQVAILDNLHPLFPYSMIKLGIKWE